MLLIFARFGLAAAVILSVMHETQICLSVHTCAVLMLHVLHTQAILSLLHKLDRGGQLDTNHSKQ